MTFGSAPQKYELPYLTFAKLVSLPYRYIRPILLGGDAPARLRTSSAAV